MNRGQWLGLVYVAVAAGFGGWRGSAVWSGWGVWVLGLFPLLVAVVGHVCRTRGNRLSLVLVTAVPTLAAAAWIAACGVGTAWVAAEGTRTWKEPALRAGAGVAGALLAGLAVAGGLSSRAAGPRHGTGPADQGGPASQEPPDGQRDRGRT